jgi:hypothetical protein
MSRFFDLYAHRYAVCISGCDLIKTFLTTFEMKKAQNFACLRVRVEMEPGCQIVLGPNIPKRENYTKMTTNCTTWALHVRNSRKLFQMDLKYTIIFHSKALQIKPKLGILV